MENIRIDPSIRHIWSHEMSTALALAKAGYKIKLVAANDYSKSADAYVDRKLFEFKSPEGSKIRSIEHILKKAAKQSNCVVLDPARVKNMRDDSIYNFLKKWVLSDRNNISRIIFVNKNREVFDIKRKVR